MLFVALAAASFVQASAGEPPHAERWKWDPTTAICSLEQEAASGESSVTVERTPGNDETELQFTLHGTRNVRAGRFFDARIRTESGETFVGDVSIAVQDGRTHLYVDSQDPAFVARLSGTAFLEFSHSKMKSFSVPIHVSPAVLATLGQCEDDTMRQWGVDPAAWRRLKQRPSPVDHIRERLGRIEYPRDALAQNVAADVIVRLDVAADGTLTGCTALNPGLMPVFQAIVCKALKGERFHPAVDATGKSAPAPIIYHARFMIAD